MDFLSSSGTGSVMLGWYLVIFLGVFFLAEFLLTGKKKDGKSSSPGWGLLLIPLFLFFLFAVFQGGGILLGDSGFGHVFGFDSFGSSSDSASGAGSLFGNVIGSFFGLGGAHQGSASATDGGAGVGSASGADVIGAYSTLFGSRFLLTFKILSGALGAASLFGIIYVFIASQALYHTPPRRKIVHTEDPTVVSLFLKEEWDLLTKKLEEASDEDAPYVVIEADAIVDRVLKDRGIEGETMGDRLKNLQYANFKNLDALWDAHRIRNQIAHEGAKSVHYSDAVYAIGQYEKALREFGVI